MMSEKAITASVKGLNPREKLRLKKIPFPLLFLGGITVINLWSQVRLRAIFLKVSHLRPITDTR